MVVRDGSRAALRRFFVQHGLPTGLLNQGDKYQLTLSADSVEKIAA